MSDVRNPRTGLDRPTVVLLLMTLTFGLLHHTDHVLRVDHSGWPFRDQVTAFTFSLLVYPVVLFALFGPVRLYWLRWALILGGTAFVLFAHTAVETPHGQFTMWADNHSTDPAAAGTTNLLDVESSVLGVLSVSIGIALNVTAVVATLAMLRGGLRLRQDTTITRAA